MSKKKTNPAGPTPSALLPQILKELEQVHRPNFVAAELETVFEFKAHVCIFTPAQQGLQKGVTHAPVRIVRRIEDAPMVGRRQRGQGIENRPTNEPGGGGTQSVMQCVRDGFGVNRATSQCVGSPDADGGVWTVEGGKKGIEDDDGVAAVERREGGNRLAGTAVVVDQFHQPFDLGVSDGTP